MKRILLLLALAVGAFAADTPVLISDTLNLQSPTHWNGVITVSWPKFTASGGTTVAKGSQDFTITDGAINIGLYSTVGASPSFLYAVRYRSTDAATRGLTWTETWGVPDTGPVTLFTVRQASNAVMVSAVGKANGTYCLTVLNGVVTGLTACTGGGGGALSWASLTDGQWTAMTDGQWTAITN
jgi:hypothetical protein